MKKILSEKNSVRLLWFGILLFILGAFVFIWKETFSTHLQINSEKFSQFGDLIGGIIGSIWSLAGVILFYVALTEQRNDIQINRETLVTQVEAMNQQIKEFELQRVELEETRKVFQEQSITLKNQRFENTLFQLLNLHHELVDKFSLSIDGFIPTKHLEKREVITHAFKVLNNEIFSIDFESGRDSSGQLTRILKVPDNIEDAEQKLNKAYKTFYYVDSKQVLSHYFRNIYHVFKFIFTSNLIAQEEKQFYASIVRAQLSSDELFLILYNSLQVKLGYPNFLFLIKEFDIMQNFDFGLIEKYKFHKEIYTTKIASVVPEFNYQK